MIKNKKSYCIKASLLLLILSQLHVPVHAQQPKPNQPDNLWIGIFWPPSWAHTNDMQYERLRHAGVDVIQNTTSTDLATPERNLKMLELGAKHHLLISVADPELYGNDEAVASYVDKYKNHPALFGYYIKDEPGIPELEAFAQKYKLLLNLDSNSIPYLNLYPNFGVEGNYEQDYVERWIQLVGAKNLRYLSFDHYPFTLKETFAPGYFENMEYIRKTGLKYGIKTSAYLQSVGISNAYRRPSVPELEFSAYVNLAYGIKMPVWFTYYTPTSNTEKFVDAILARDGTPTDLYEPFKAINQKIKVLGKTLFRLDAVATYHIGGVLPKGVPELPDDFAWKPVGNQDLIITDFRDQQTGASYLMIVNKSLTAPLKYSMNIAKNIKSINEIDQSNGKQKSLSIPKKTGMLEDALLPGAGKLYAVNQN